jgi:uncharacterized protein (DUF488 family)
MPVSRLLTVGHSTLSAEDFLERLHAHGVDRLADIRTIPQSRRHPQFGRDALAAFLGTNGILYRHLPALGGLRRPAPDSPNGAWHNLAFRGYADHMLTPAFDRAIDELLEFVSGGRGVVMCAEAVWWRCHRMLLSDALVARGLEVLHVMSAAAAAPHRLTPFAKVRDDGQVWYPGVV